MAIITQSNLTFFIRDLYSRHGFASYILENIPDGERKVEAWSRADFTTSRSKEALRGYFTYNYKGLDAEFIFSEDDLKVAFPAGMVYRTVTFSIKFSDPKTLNKMKLKYPNLLAQR